MTSWATREVLGVKLETTYNDGTTVPDAAFQTFVSIEAFEVRHEVLARVKDLETWIDLGLKGDEFIEADENEQLKKHMDAAPWWRPANSRVKCVSGSPSMTQWAMSNCCMSWSSSENSWQIPMYTSERLVARSHRPSSCRTTTICRSRPVSMPIV